MVRKLSLKDQAIKLRKQGYSYSYIISKTGLSKSTLSYHLTKIPFTPNDHTKKTIKKAQFLSAVTKKKQKLASLKQAEVRAQEIVGTLSDRDVFMLGLGLYIGEGSKTQDLTRLVNADVRVIQFYIRWLYTLGLCADNIALRVHLYPDSDIKQSELYWLKKTCLPQSALQKTYIDTRVQKERKKSGAHIHGTAHITVRANGKKEFGVALARMIAACSDLVLE